MSDNYGDGDQNEVLRDASSDEHDNLIAQPDTGSDTTPSSALPKVLLLMGPALLSGVVVKAFDIAFLATLYTRIASELHHFTDGTWILLAASICAAVCVPLYSCLLKTFGVKRMMVAAYSAYAIGSGLCGLSMNFWQLLGARFVLGFGSAGITLLTMVVINDIVGMKRLPIWESLIIGLEMSTSIAAGPIGAWMYRKFGWHTIFFLQFTLMLGGVATLFWSFSRVKSHLQSSDCLLLRKGDMKAPRVDVEGWLLLVLAVAVPLVGFTLADNDLSWTHPAEISLLVAAPVFAIAFILFETRLAAVPVLDMTPIMNPRYLNVLAQEFLVMSILNSIVYTVEPYIQVRAIEGSAFADWALSCVFLGFSTGATLGGYLIKASIFPVRRIMLANAVCLLVFCILFGAKIIEPESINSAPFLVGFGVCTGVWQSCLLYASLSSASKKWWTQALALYYLVETFGGDLGMILMATITRSVSKSRIRAVLGRSTSTEKIISDALRDLGSIRRLDPALRDSVAAAFERGMHFAFALPTAMAVIVIFLAAVMETELPQAANEDIEEA